MTLSVTMAVNENQKPGRNIWFIFLFVAIVHIGCSDSNMMNPNSDDSTIITSQSESRFRTSDGHTHIQHINKTQNFNGTRQSDQITILGKSRISIPQDGSNWSGSKVMGGDSYIKALEYSQNIRNDQTGAVEINSKSTQVIRREFNPSPMHKQKGQDYRTSGNINPRILYPVPKMQNSYAEVPEEFSPPIQSSSDFNMQTPFVPTQGDNFYETYGSPQPSYESFPPTQDVYGPSLYAPEVYKPMQSSLNNYGYPQQGYGSMTYGSPHSFDLLSSAGLSWSLLKLNASTIAKILLKFVIFKLIVKFIGLVCLLLFIPKLDFRKDSEDDTENEDRSYQMIESNKYLDDLTTTVLTAIQDFEKSISEAQEKKSDSCTSIWCIIKNSFMSEENSSIKEEEEEEED